MKSLGLKLLELRQQHKLTQQQLCEKIHISRASYSYFENGKRIPDLETLLLFARFYDISPDYLLSYEADNIAVNQSERRDEEKILHHLKSKHIPIDAILSMSKHDFEFLAKYNQLSEDNKAEIIYLINYKLRKEQNS